MEGNRFDTAIFGGTLVSGTDVRPADIGIIDGVVVHVGRIKETRARSVIDATNKLVLPGGVDEHIHPIYLDDVATCSLGAVFGGTTTVMYFAYAKPGERLVDSVNEMVEQGGKGSFLDFAVHVGLFEAEKQVEEIEAVAAMGVRSFKTFMTYASLGWATDDFQMMRVMERVSDVGGLIMVHAENGLGIDYLEAQAKAGRGRGSDQSDTWLSTRPAAFEAEAVYRACALAEVTGCDLFVPHVTCRRAADVIGSRRADGQGVVGETCPHYLTLTSEEVRKRGTLAKIAPPLRTTEDTEALWEALRTGVLQSIGSDHAPKKTPMNASEDLLTAEFGAPTVETRLPVLYDAAINEGRLTLQRLVQLVAENPARIFGIYPRKGAILPGSDADVVLWDPFKAYQIKGETLQTKAGYTLHEGRRCLGGPTLVMQRGKVLMRDGDLVAVEPAGEFLANEGVDVLLGDSPG